MESTHFLRRYPSFSRTFPSRREKTFESRADMTQVLIDGVWWPFPAVAALDMFLASIALFVGETSTNSTVGISRCFVAVGNGTVIYNVF